MGKGIAAHHQRQCQHHFQLVIIDVPEQVIHAGAQRQAKHDPARDLLHQQQADIVRRKITASGQA